MVVHIRIGDQDRQLMGNDAQVFLSSRDYIRFDRDRNRWVITDKYRRWKKWSTTWEGTWIVMSKHLTGRWTKGEGKRSQFTVVLKGGACQMYRDDKPPLTCSITKNKLVPQGPHESGGKLVRYTFVREGIALDPEMSRFEGPIGGLQSSGTFSGTKVDQ